jgi:pimeloyl-ACP methyl ester carboxylesterase
MGTNNIVLVHGLWMTPLSWEYWAHHYTGRGYSVYAPSWPGMERDVRALRRAPETYANIGFKQIVDHYEKLVIDLESAPILIGHSFGGLVVQALLDRGLGSCGVAIASAPIKGIWALPYSTMRVVTPQLINPRNSHRCLPLTPAQFHYAFMNNSTREESFRIYQRYAVPGPDRVLFQTELANFNPFAETAVNVRRNNRAPLLMVAGSQDHVIPPRIVKANIRAYRHSTAVTEYKEFTDRTHFIIGQSGWEEVANYSLDWTRDQELVVEREQRRISRQPQARQVA